MFDAPPDLPAAAAVEPVQEPSPQTADDFPSPLDSPQFRAHHLTWLSMQTAMGSR